MRVLIIGRAGQLATAIVEQAASRPDHDVFLLGRPDFDLEKPDDIGWQIRRHNPDIVINTAAYTAVDKAEIEPDLAFQVNRDGAATVAHAAERIGVPFIHISTDYVFDGRKPAPYVETDDTGPLNVYGRSKLAGEHAVFAAHPNALVLRTSWVYSPFGNNFLKTMLRLGAERPLLKVVDDQHGNPTSAQDLAAAILHAAPILKTEKGGLYHLTGTGSTSWHGFAAFIFEECGRRGGPVTRLEAISGAAYKAPARRPTNSRLDCSAFSKRFGHSLRPWTDAVSDTVTRCLSG